MREYTYTGSKISHRKNFILFCTESAAVNTLDRDGIFDKHFYPCFLKLAYSEQNFEVQRCLVKALPSIRRAIIDSDDGAALLKLNQLLSEMKRAYSQHRDVKELFDQVVSTFQTDEEKRKVADMELSRVEAKRMLGLLHRQRQEAREAFEKQASNFF